MAEYVVIRAGNAAEPSEWVLVDSNGTQKSRVSTGTLDQAASEAGDRPVIALVPALDVMTTQIAIPIRSAAKIRSALPFALEESVADDVDKLHFASGSRRDDGRVPVAVTSKDNMQRWVETYAAAGIELARMVPENQGLPVLPGTMSLLIDGRTTFFNDGDRIEFAMQDMKPSDVLVAAGCLGDDHEGDPESSHLVVFCDADSAQRFETDFIALRHELDSVDVNVLQEGALPKIAVTVATGQGVNLLQGAYGRTPEYAAMLRPWKTAAVLLIGLGLLAFVAKGVDYYRLSSERDALQAQFTEEYRAIRPGDTRDIADPANTVRSLQRGASPGAAPPVFLQSLEALSGAVSGNSDASLEAISYRAGVVDIRLVAPDVATLDQIQQDVARGGAFQATIQSAEQVGDVVDGRMQIREGS
ncbi:MAG: type II secretion system protein GspL [Pseudomonadota bacterium]